MLTATDVAKVCHAANAELCRVNNDWSQFPWIDAPQWARDSAVNGVIFHVENPGATPEDSHRNWMREKAQDGWMYGPKKDPEFKTHPCMVSYDRLLPEQRAKDHLFRAIVHALKPFMALDAKEQP